ncbi:MAG TPA: hypothetical protein V6C89_18275 [Drouetiella sp.]|jgi:hypothetical protein
MSLSAERCALTSTHASDGIAHEASVAMSSQMWGSQGMNDMRRLNHGASRSSNELPAGMPSAESLFAHQSDQRNVQMAMSPANDNNKPVAPPKVYPISPSGKMWVVPVDSLPPGGQIWISPKGVTVLTPEQIP